MFLLDVNCLVAMFDSRHVNHEVAHAWFENRAVVGWASCPITENGLVRVLSNPAYKTVEATPVEVIERLDEFCGRTNHEFWSDSTTIRDFEGDLKVRLFGHGQITDFYLASLARRNKGILATFDRTLIRTLGSSDCAGALELIT